jgi:hypothetical protein
MDNTISNVVCASSNDQSIEEIKNRVVRALENEKYDWRTFEGIIRETKLSRDDVSVALTQLDDEGKLVQSYGSNKRNNPLFTTRDYYNRSRTIIDQIKSSWADAV